MLTLIKADISISIEGTPNDGKDEYLDEVIGETERLLFEFGDVLANYLRGKFPSSGFKVRVAI